MSLSSLTSTMRGTSGQDVERAPTAAGGAARRRLIAAGGAAATLFALIAWGFSGWLGTEMTVSRAKLACGVVERGRFVRDTAARGTVVAAVSPTLFATAPARRRDRSQVTRCWVSAHREPS
jgi:HlyD family secretion protein